ncbi:MAG TPA: QsdR family transcriptional regulator [Solirubrobacteraceae bacterium]|jgi:AcrR family transcriptional regulator|nr:QsdR family transcriptional regulator [Solirubrobacteraceae bacterium]
MASLTSKTDETSARAATGAAAATRANGSAKRQGPRDAFRLARHKWRIGERVDMSALARELGINRVTLYRWVGSREQLLVEVIWNLTNHNLTTAAAAVGAEGVTGPERIIQTVTRFIDKAISHRGMQTWLANEGEAAMRLLTRHQAGFQPRLVARLEELLQEEVDSGRLDLPADVHEVAYVLEQLVESYVYLFPIAGEQPEARRAEPILRMLLR